MAALKYLIGLMLCALMVTPAAAQHRDSERRTWKVVRRGGGTEQPERVSTKDDFQPNDSESAAVADPINSDLNAVQYADDSQLEAPIVVPDDAVYAEEFYEGAACDAACCDDGCCDAIGCGMCRQTYWVSGQYLYWQLAGAEAPPLITTSTAGTAFADAGVLGLPTTAVLLGDERIGDDGRSGGRIEVGRWVDQCHRFGWHVAYFGFDTATERWNFAGTTIPILGRPFFSVEPGFAGPNADLFAFPDEVEGNATVTSSISFDGAEAMLHCALVNDACRQLQFVAGYQYLGLEDELAIDDFKTITGQQSGLTVGTTLDGTDRFECENQFHGAAIGFIGAYRNCQWTVDAGMQLALGNTNSQVRIDGSTTSTVPVPGGGVDTATTVGGLLALPSNIGQYEDDVFAVAPQLHVNIGFDLAPQWRATVGYRFLYWSQVARAAEQIDTGINLSQLDPGGLVGEPRPQFDFLFSDLWAHGLNAGLEYRF